MRPSEHRKNVVRFDVAPQEKNYSFKAGHYFEVKIEHVVITADEFTENIKQSQEVLDVMFAESEKLNVEINKQLSGLKYE